MILLWVLCMFQTENALIKSLSQAVDQSVTADLRKVVQEVRPKGPTEDDRRAINHLGWQLMNTDKLKAAIAVFQLNVQLFPDLSNPYYGLAVAYLNHGKPEKSAESFEKVFSIQPNRHVWRRLGSAYSAWGNAKKEHAYARRGLKLYADEEAQDVLLAARFKHDLAKDPKAEFAKSTAQWPRAGFWRTRQTLKAKGISLKDRPDGWKESSYQAMGLDSRPFNKLVEAADKGEYGLLEGLVIVKRDAIIGEAYFGDFSRYRPHDTRSVGKSVTAMVAGLAVDRGKLNLEDRLYDHFPEYRKLKGWDQKKNDVKLVHLLGMSSGLNAFDNREDSPGNENFYQENIEKWADHVLKLSMAFEPGSELVYASANYLLAGNTIGRATGQEMDRFAEAHLFAPMGITDYRWYYAPDGKAYGAGGIRMTPRDLAKIGSLISNQGLFAGKRIVSKAWIQEISTPRVPGELWSKKYGLGWYSHEEKVQARTIKVISASGNGGQRIWVMPELEAVIVLTMGHYNSRKQRMADKLLKEILVPSLLGK